MDNKENNINPNPEPEMEVEVDIEQIEITEGPESIGEPINTGSVEAPVQTEVPTQSTMAAESEQPIFAKQPQATGPADPKKKKKIAMIIGICVAAVLLIGGGVFAAIYMSWRNSDEVVILDAVTGVIEKSKIAVSGTVDVTLNSTNERATSIKSAKIVLDADQDKADMSGSGKLSIVTSDDKTTDVAIGGAFVSDGTMYFKIEGVKNALDAFDDLTSEIDEYLPLIEGIIDAVDGNWYKVSISDLNLNSEAEESYQCMVDAINTAVKEDSKKELADLYKEYPFLVSEKREEKDSKGNTVYKVDYEDALLADFMNGAIKTKAFKAMGDCNDFETDKTLKPEDVKDMREDMPEINLHIDGHTLRGLSTNYTDDGNSIKAELYFVYDNDVNVEIPSDAKSVKELMTSVEDSLKSVIVSMMEEQVKTQCSAYTGANYTNCIDYYSKAIEESINNMDISEMWGITSGAV